MHPLKLAVAHAWTALLIAVLLSVDQRTKAVVCVVLQLADSVTVVADVTTEIVVRSGPPPPPHPLTSMGLPMSPETKFAVDDVRVLEPLVVCPSETVFESATALYGGAVTSIHGAGPETNRLASEVMFFVVPTWFNAESLKVVGVTIFATRPVVWALISEVATNAKRTPRCTTL